MFEQQQDTGSASSLINFGGMLLGSIGMLLISGKTENSILIIGIMQAAIGLIGFLFWSAVKNKP